MDEKQRQLIRKYIDIVLRRKKMIIIFLLLATVAGLGKYLLTPKTYEATALLSYQQQKVNPNRMSPDVSGQIKDTVSTLTQIVMSRSNLERIIKDLHLYDIEREKFPMEDVIDGMREVITIKPSLKGDTFFISFQGPDPEKVVKVTNALASKFIEENLKYREERASETSDYTRDELGMAKTVLDKKEATIRDYKLKYYNEMPEQRQGNVARLIALQEQYQSKQDSIQNLEHTKVLVQEQIAARKKILTEMRAVALAEEAPLEGEGDPVASVHERWKRLKAREQALLTKYTDKHPEVKRIRTLLKGMEGDVAAEQQSTDTTSGTVSQPKEKAMSTDSVLVQLELQMRSISLNIKSLNREREQLRNSISEYEKWVAAAPIREAEWSALTREYSELKRHYDFLVAQNLQAESVLHLERKQQGSQFKIEDPARLPENPVKPDFISLMGISLLVGLALGGGLAFGLELLDTSFKDTAEIEEFLDLPVICSLPYIQTKEEVRQEKRARVWWGLALLVSVLCICLGFGYFWTIGRIIL